MKTKTNMMGMLHFLRLKVFISTKTREIETTIKGSRSANSAVQNDFKFVSKEDDSWNNCIKRESKEEANILVEKEIMPSRGALNDICRLFGIHSPILSDVCSLISKYIKTYSEDVIDVWPSYRFDNECSDNCLSIVFVVLVKKNSLFSSFKDYECYIKRENELSNEGKLVATKEIRDETNFDLFTDDILEQIRICINKRADDLLESHRYLNVIMPSLKKSTGYMSNNHEIYDEPCIACYVTVKGYIPLDEGPFEKEIDGFKIDVLEGEFEPFTGGPNEYHEHLKIGLAIHAKVLNGDGVLAGSLGGFVDHSVRELCGITCAHVVYNNFELIEIKENKSFGSKKVYQPIGEGSLRFGEVVNAVFKEGNQSEPGVEVALIKIQSRKPIDGSFPETFNDFEAGFDYNNPLCYNSGEVSETSHLRRRTEVYKFGMSTGITRGSFALQGAVVRKQQMQGQHRGFGFNLKNQIVILQIGENHFAEPGDSGALVLMEGQHDSVANGIVEGGMKGRVFVTPICDILRALGCTEGKMHQFTQLKNPEPVDLGVQMEI